MTRFGGYSSSNNLGLGLSRVSVASLNPLDRLLRKEQAKVQQNKTVDQLDTQELEAILIKRKREEAARKLEAEMMRKQRVVASGSLGFMDEAGSSNIGLNTNTQHISMVRMMRQLQKQQEMLTENWKKMEEQRRFNDLQTSINQLSQMISLKDGGHMMTDPGHHQENKGSVRARVGPKNHPNKDSSSLKSRLSMSRKEMFDGDDERDNKRKKYTNRKLPDDLVLTHLTEAGPKPAPARITWSDEEDLEDGNWKRAKRGRRFGDDLEEEGQLNIYN